MDVKVRNNVLLGHMDWKVKQRFLCLSSVTWFHVSVYPHGIALLSCFCPVRLALLGQILWAGISHNASKNVNPGMWLHLFGLLYLELYHEDDTDDGVS